MAITAVFVDGLSVLPSTTTDAGWVNTALPSLGSVVLVTDGGEPQDLGGAARGGDDAPDRGHRGWDKRLAMLKRKRDREFTEQIRDLYRALTGDPATAERAEAIVATVAPPAPARGESEAAREAALFARAETLRRRADASDARAVEAELALRLLYRELRDQQEHDDVSAIEQLLAQVL